MSPSVDLSPIVGGAVDTASTSISPIMASVTVDFDKSVLVQMALFSLLILVLKPLLLDPMLRVFALREERTDGAKAEARAMQEKAADILMNYESEVAKVRASATSERDALRLETAKLEAKILAEARAAADSIADEGRARIQGEMTVFHEELNTHTQSLAQQISGRVLGREITS